MWGTAQPPSPCARSNHPFANLNYIICWDLSKKMVDDEIFTITVRRVRLLRVGDSGLQFVWELLSLLSFPY